VYELKDIKIIGKIVKVSEENVWLGNVKERSSI
jgi:hypothetical protein